MKERLISHLNMVFQTLSIKSEIYVYDCSADTLPEWARHLSHPYRYFVCTPAIEDLVLLKKFLCKDIFVSDRMLYWYDGDAIEPTCTSKNISSTGNVETLRLKTNTRLPSWLDEYIFKTLHAQYAPNHERFDFNLDLTETDVLKYLGTYFPRSYAESFCIFDNLFRNKAYSSIFHIDAPINIAAIGCGTGGDLMGLLTVIGKYSTLNRPINIIAVDGNSEALSILSQILEKYKQYFKKELYLKIIPHTFVDMSSFDSSSIGASKSFDFVLCSKMICELIASGRGRNDDAYYDYVMKFLPLLNERGIFYLLDVTTRQKHSTFNPFLLNEQVQRAMANNNDYVVISPVPCSFFNQSCNKSCFYQKTFSITHSNIREDISKVAYKLIAHKGVYCLIGAGIEGSGKYQIHTDKVCPHTEAWTGGYIDAFYIPETPYNTFVSDEDLLSPVKVNNEELSNRDYVSPTISVSTESVQLPSQDDRCIGRQGSMTDAGDNNESSYSDDYYIGCYIIDTNVFVEKPNIIDSIPEDYFVVLSAKVLEELDYLKTKKNISVAGKKRANRALKNISDSLSRKDREIIMEDSDVRLLPKDFDKHNPDNKILSVALKFVGENPILLTSDFGLQARSKAMGVDSISLKEYKKINNN